MAKKISADTITTITGAAGFHDPAKKSVPPTALELQTETRQRLVNRIADIKSGKMNNYAPAGGAVRFSCEELLARAEEQLRDFDEIIKTVPEGFKLVPVYYARIDSSTNNSIANEYMSRVRHRYLQHLAENHEGELRRLGIDDSGIERMRHGFDPVDKNGQHYEVNVDHIIERSGCGQWSKKKTRDPEQPPDAGDKCPVNHFGNLILLPEQIHKYKNRLNQLQRTESVRPGDAMWVLMMVPVVDATHSGYVCPPQPAGHPLAGILRKKEDVYSKMGRVDFAVQRMGEMVDKFKNHPIVGNVLKSFEEIARRQGRKVCDVANDQALKADPTQATLRGIFNDLASYDPDIDGLVENRLKPLIDDASKEIKHLFNFASADTSSDKGRRAFKSFNEYFYGKAFKEAREDLRGLPFREAAVLEKELCDIDEKVRALQAALQNRPQLTTEQQRLREQKNLKKKTRRGNDKRNGRGPHGGNNNQ